ncbi:hypothetical protein GCM10009525_04670 [Streptosporangium amethystogenes subsp. fukuiense]
METRTPGAAGGPGKPTVSNHGRAPRSDPTRHPEWRRSPEVAGSARPDERAVDVDAWKRAAQLVDAVRVQLQHTAPGNVAAWRSSCRGAGRPGPSAAPTDRLVW